MAQTTDTAQSPYRRVRCCRRILYHRILSPEQLAQTIRFRYKIFGDMICHILDSVTFTYPKSVNCLDDGTDPDN
ncbi:MAG: hypothetical protein WCJ06_14130 [Planctomycetota bacterium]